MSLENRAGALIVVALSLVLTRSEGALAQGGLVDFESVPPKTVVTTQFASQGFRFVPSAFIDSDPAARSGTQVLRAANPTTEFNPGPLTIEFSSGQAFVRMFAADRFAGTTGTLRAFDAGGSLVAEDGPKAVSVDSYTTEFQVTAGSAVIRRVVLQYSTTGFESIDDLEFKGIAPARLPATPPAVKINLDEGTTTSLPALTLTGTVTGEQLVSPARLQIEVKRPPNSTTPSATMSFVALEGAGGSLTFSIPLQLQVGPQTITVTAENAGGLTGQASVRVSLFPRSFTDAIQEEGSPGFGEFLFSGSDQGCVYAVFERGVLGQAGGFAIARGAILKKWLSQSQNGFPTLGCPIGLERSIKGDAARLQDFQKARIYIDQSDAFFTPAVFSQAIDAHGGETKIGIPLEDPSASVGAMQTFLFQRFRRPGRSDHDATLEIRGTPPSLFVERKADDPRIPIPSPTSPTLVDEHPCTTNLGPCEIRFESEVLLGEMGRFCNNEHFDWEGVAAALLDNSKIDLIDTNPKEWSAVEGDHVLTPMRGIVLSARIAGGDNPFAHEFPVNCPTTPAGFLPLVAAWTKDREPNFCSADLDVTVEPLRGFRKLIGVGVGSNPNHNNDVVIEYERGHARAFTAFGGDPHVGDLVFTAGRWIVDCGHAYHTEIHPPSALAYMRTVTTGQRPATVAHVWVNGFYPGDVLDIFIHPPPRPSPDAVLNVDKNHAPSNTGVTVEEDLGFGQLLRLRVSAPRRLVKVTDMGEMKMETGRQFMARYRLFWTRA